MGNWRNIMTIERKHYQFGCDTIKQFTFNRSLVQKRKKIKY